MNNRFLFTSIDYFSLSRTIHTLFRVSLTHVVTFLPWRVVHVSTMADSLRWYMGLSVSPVSHGISGDMTAMNPFMGRRQSWLFVVTVCTGVDMMQFC